jgi:quercetin dioxygenase-like cupin family protein
MQTAVASVPAPPLPLETIDAGADGSLSIFEEGDETAPLRATMVMGPGMGPPAPEHHPEQTETFTVLRGRLDLGVVDGRHVVLSPGESLTIPPGTDHQPRAADDQEVAFEFTLTPGYDHAELFRALFFTAQDHRGLGRIVRFARLFRRFRHIIRFRRAFSMVLASMATVAGLLGIRPGVGVTRG